MVNLFFEHSILNYPLPLLKFVNLLFKCLFKAIYGLFEFANFTVYTPHL